jgi:hypothetical protein
MVIFLSDLVILASGHYAPWETWRPLKTCENFQ